MIRLYALYVFGKEYKYFYQLRQAYLKNGDDEIRQQSYYTIMVERIPPHLRTDNALTAWFEEMFPGQIFGATICTPSTDLIKLYRKRCEAVDNLEHQIAAEQATGERPLVRAKMCGEKVDGIELYQNELSSLNDEIKTHQVTSVYRCIVRWTVFHSESPSGCSLQPNGAARRGEAGWFNETILVCTLYILFGTILLASVPHTR